MALQPRRAKTDWSGYCQMAVQGALWLSKRLSLNLNFSFLHRISLLLIQVATQLSSRGWVDPVPDFILPEKFLWYSRESNPGPIGWQSDLLTTIPNGIHNKNITLNSIPPTITCYVQSLMCIFSGSIKFISEARICEICTWSEPAKTLWQTLQHKDAFCHLWSIKCISISTYDYKCMESSWLWNWREYLIQKCN